MLKIGCRVIYYAGGIVILHNGESSVNLIFDILMNLGDTSHYKALDLHVSLKYQTLKNSYSIALIFPATRFPNTSSNSWFLLSCPVVIFRLFLLPKYLLTFTVTAESCSPPAFWTNDRRLNIFFLLFHL
jgi:hypothetical protein